MSPSCTSYSFPSERTRPASRAAFIEPHRTNSSYGRTSARINPRSKSLWITPAASGARAPRRAVQARTSFSLKVKKVMSPKSAYPSRMSRGSPGSVRPASSRYSGRSPGSSSASSASNSRARARTRASGSSSATARRRATAYGSSGRAADSAATFAT